MSDIFGALSMRRTASIALLSLALTSCIVARPEGPAERIGRGIDEITQALDDLPAGRPVPTPTPRPSWDHGLWEDRSRSNPGYDRRGYDSPTERDGRDSTQRSDDPYY